MKIGLIGLGAMGRMHFDCWQKSPHGKLVAVSDRNPKLLAGDWGGTEFNLGDQAAAKVSFDGMATFPEAEQLLADPNVEAVDICMPTPFHAPLSIAAMRAGKHVFCEKPMSLSLADCVEMERVAQETGRRLMVGHCLRYWPQYVKAQALLASGEFGRAVYASFHRSGAAPAWSGDAWYLRGAESGGVLDMHIHDVDVALWWFGRPQSIATTGLVTHGLPLIVDAAWHYEGGPTVQLHGSWDRNGGPFRHAFRLVMEKATLVHDLAVDASALQLLREGKTENVPIEETSAYQAELDDFAACLAAGRAPERITPADSRLAVEVGLEELRQIGVGEGK
ncbi:MAG: Gfo/Idh/MocA family oxidoreductase [Chthoniobacter sp.]|nr:Gfo/Idh/MocA family oxidoreductase [Chthoniobacter sp.]